MYPYLNKPHIYQNLSTQPIYPHSNMPLIQIYHIYNNIKIHNICILNQMNHISILMQIHHIHIIILLNVEEEKKLFPIFIFIFIFYTQSFV